MVIIWLMMVNNNLVGGLNPTHLKNDGVSNSWDYEIPNIWKVIKVRFQATNQFSYMFESIRLWLLSTKFVRAA